MILITCVLYVLLEAINLKILSGFYVSKQYEQMKLQVVWDVANFRPVNSYRQFKGEFFLHIQGKETKEKNPSQPRRQRLCELSKHQNVSTSRCE
jgi:16S rRNA C1402 (ribose-2'-O) methylase RsmI